ncbi:MAG: hypothetical protein H6577_21210 [Lewinellaceae bacterium]|nr:hypothetical protein [Saprospiraceae bacterium]MCB9340650.1 hypothetical protein [Lewinellaceae bacterium]
MKANHNSFLAVAFALFLSIPFTQGQRTLNWMGGTPGHETDWQCPKNWYEGRLPDEFSNVSIADVSTRSLVYPVLKDAVWINSLRLEGNARLTILNSGQLTIYQDAFIPHQENLKVNGLLNILNELEEGGKQPATASLAKN